MKKYVLKRILMMIPTLLAVVFIIFVLINITPGDPGRIMLGQDAAQEDVDAINATMHMDKPLIVRYLYYIWDAMHLDFGVSFLTRQPVFADLFEKNSSHFHPGAWDGDRSCVDWRPFGRHNRC